nr:hypothetical protein [Tanacetum cinerariifolium]
EQNRSGRISRVLVAEGKGRGYCAMMVQAILQLGFEQLHLHRIDLGVYDFNHAAIRCYKKCGLQVDGVLRDVMRHDDHYWSLVEMKHVQQNALARHSQERCNDGAANGRQQNRRQEGDATHAELLKYLDNVARALGEHGRPAQAALLLAVAHPRPPHAR